MTSIAQPLSSSKVIGIDPGSGCTSGDRAGTSGTGIVMVDGPDLVHYETTVGDAGAHILETVALTIVRVCDLLGSEARLWTMAIELPLIPSRRSRAVLESAILAGALHAWGSIYCADAVGIEAGRFPKTPPPAELVGRRGKGTRRMNAPAPNLCRSRDHEQDAYSLARYVQGQLTEAAA